MSKKPGVYMKVVLSVVALLLVLDVVGFPGNVLVRQAMATIGTITGQGTINYLSRFAGASGSPVNVIGDSIVYDDGSNHIGINTASPGSTLDVKGTLRLSGATSGYVGFAPATAAGSTTYTLPSADGTNGYQLTTNGTGTLSWAAAGSGGSSQWTTTGSDIYYNTGKVGIGTATPDTRLDLNGGTISMGALGAAGEIRFRTTFANNASGGSGLTAADHDGANVDGLNIYGHDGVSIFTHQTERVTVQYGGNVGIGTTGPANKLELGSGSMSFYYGDVSGYGTNAQLGRISAQGDNYHGSSATNSSSEIRFLTGSANYYKGQIAFYTNNVDSTAGAAVERMRIKEDGNVGIGTTSPGAKLEVAGVVSAATGATGGFRSTTFTAGQNLIWAFGNAPGYGFSYKQGGSDDIRFHFGDFNSPQFLIRQDGNVGIGTTTPSTALQVNGTVTATTFSGSLSGNATSATTAGAAYPYRVGGVVMQMNWSGQGGQPTWLWGGNDGTNFYVYNPSNFSVNYATTAGNVSSLAGTWTGLNYFVGNCNTASCSNPSLMVFSTGGNGATMSFHRGGYYAVNMGLDSDNVLRIGGWSAAANRWQLDMSGNETIPGYITAAGGFFYSDIRLKKNIVPLQNGLQTILALQGVRFNWKDSGKAGIGLIAQDVEKVLPELVTTNSATGLKSVEYGNIVAPLIESVKELKQESDAKDKKIAQLENEIKEIRQTLAK